VIKLELRNPLVYFDPINVNMANMFEHLLSDSLNEHLYAAELAGLKYNISTTNYGMSTSFSGFSDKINVLLETVYEKMASFKVDPQRFAIIKESYRRDLTNFEAEQPFKHAVYYMTMLIAEKGWTKRQLLDSLDDFTIDDLQAFIPKLLTKGVFIEAIAYGNISEQRASELLRIVESKLAAAAQTSRIKPLEKAQQRNSRQFQLSEGANYVFLKNNTVHKTTSIEVYYQCGVQSNRNNALVQLFCQVINESGFNILRTKEQLGYIVASGVRNFGGAQGCKVIIQSDRSPAYLDERIENFISLTRESVAASMSDDEFKQHVDALVLNKLEEPKKMSKQVDIYWSEIVAHQYHFEREQVEVDELKKLTKSDLVQFMQVMRFLTLSGLGEKRTKNEKRIFCVNERKRVFVRFFLPYSTKLTKN
jgi:insulysin